MTGTTVGQTYSRQVTGTTADAATWQYIELAGQWRSTGTIGMHADFFQRARRRQPQTENADGAGNRRFIGNDLVGIHRNPVTA